MMKKISGLLILTGMVTFVSAVEITFRVNMSEVENVSADGVHIAGNFPSANWDPATIELSDNNNDNIYELSLELTPGDEHEYKYINGNTWAGEEFGYGNNRDLTVPNEDEILDVVYFANEEPTEYTEREVIVTFQVDMSKLEPSWYSNGVGIKGDVVPLNWDYASTLLSANNEDLLFTGDIIFPAGSEKNVEYKFERCDADSNYTLEYIANRTFQIDDSDPNDLTQTVGVVYFNDEDPNNFTSIEVTVTFNVDISDSVSAGYNFNSMGIYGSEIPLDWSWDTMNKPMTESVTNEIWTIDIPFPIGTRKNINFKFGRNGKDLEAGFNENHSFTIDDSNPTQVVSSIYGEMGATLAEVDGWHIIPHSITILQNYPNPFNPTTKILFSLPHRNPKNAKIVIYKLTGQMVKQYSIFVNQSSITWNAENQASGVYLYKLFIDNKIIATQKMILLK